MDDKALEERLTRIEEMLAKLDHKGLRSHEILDVANLKLDLRLRRVEAAIGEFSGVERLAEAAYIKTHPEAHASVEDMKTSVYIASFDARINRRDSDS